MSGGFDPGGFDNSSGTGGFYTIAAAVAGQVVRAVLAGGAQYLSRLTGSSAGARTSGGPRIRGS
jgi:hypothetical protein